MTIISQPSIYTCSRCKLVYEPDEIVNGDIKHATIEANLIWIQDVYTEDSIDRTKLKKKTNLCNPCSDSLLQWYADNGIGDDD